MNIEKKKLIQQYKEDKPSMGCFMITCKATKDTFLGCSQHLEATRNSLFFRLSVKALGNEPELQNLYDKYGLDMLVFEVLEVLPYDKEDGEKSYDEDLKSLMLLCKENHEEAKEIHV